MVGELIRYSGWYSVKLVERFHDYTFVFGDNAKRFGKGGQAIIRDCKNALGVATKRAPTMAPWAFFSDCEEDMDIILDDLQKVWDALGAGRTVVVPVTAEGYISLGRERAQLPEKAPELYETIVMHFKEMSETYRCYDQSEL